MDLDRAHGPSGTGPAFLCADAGRLPFPDGTFDAVTYFDVLEHIPEDAAAVREAIRVLKPGGAILVTAPNEHWRFPYYPLLAPICPTDEDVMAEWGHVRRGYSLAELDRLVGSEALRWATFINPVTVLNHDLAFSRLPTRLRRALLSVLSPVIWLAYAVHRPHWRGTETAAVWRTPPARLRPPRWTGSLRPDTRRGQRLFGQPDRSAGSRRLAVLPWGDLIEDFLGPIGLSIDSFVEQMTGGWLFGYLDALATADIDSVLVCMPATVDRPVRRIHRPSGVALWLLPANPAYRWVRARLADPYAWNRATATTGLAGGAAHLAAGLRHVAPYLSTPVRALSRVLRQERCTAVLCQEYEEARFDVCVGLGRLLGVPVFATFQGGDRQRTMPERVVRRRSVNAAAGLIIASHREQERVQHRYGVPRQRIVQIGNPLDLTRWPIGNRAEARTLLGLPQDARVAVWHGRVELWRKGLDVLLKAWGRLCVERPGADLRLLLVGSGADSARLRDLLGDPGLRGVEWLDSYVVDRSRLRPYLDAADVYAFPSRHEGSAVAPLEAMACGLPLVAADAPGVREVVPRGAADGGTVVPPGDASALAEALGALLDDPARAQELGRRARARVEGGFSVPVVGRQLAAVLAGPERSPTRLGLLAARRARRG